MTAVEQLVQEINKLTGLNIAMDEPCVIQAKAMEKEIIRSAYLDGRDNEYATSKDYYNEVFKS